MNIRPRRNRKLAAIREMVQESHLATDHLIYPMFLVDGNQIKDEISSLPGNYRWSFDLLCKEIESSLVLGLNKFVLFPAVSDYLKDPMASYSYAEENFYLHAIRGVKERFPEAVLMSDVALDPYSSDGHDGLVSNGKILNDETLPILAKMSIAQAQAGIDIIGPSDMMDGRVKSIRMMLEKEGHHNSGIMSYSAKYASSFYGPFRDALDSKPGFGDKKTYQMDTGNREEAINEVRNDVEEGADIVMIKPGISYLDIIRDIKNNFNIPISAYQVSGEYAMIKSASKNGWIDENQTILETSIA